MEFELPLDHDGFVRRECPHCSEEFKWHSGPANEEAEQQPPFDTFYCPLCGEPAGPDSWWTQAQLDLIERLQQRMIGTQLNDMFDDLSRSTRNNKFIKIKSTGRFDEPNVPDALVEPDDMSIVTSPCHGWEPVKVPEDRVSPFYCLVCGAAFAV